MDYEFLNDPELTEEEKMELLMQVRQSQEMRSQGGTPPMPRIGGGESAGASAGGSTAATIAPMIVAGLAYEGNARKKGRRADSKSAHIRDTLTGRNMTTDVEALGDKIGGPGEEMMDLLGKVGKPWEWF